MTSRVTVTSIDREALAMQESWCRFYGRTVAVMTGLGGRFRERLFKECLASTHVLRDPQLGEAARRFRGARPNCQMPPTCRAARAARRVPEDTPCEMIFDDCTETQTQNFTAVHRTIPSCFENGKWKTIG